jgi:Protein of unknown function (DUF2877)
VRWPQSESDGGRYAAGHGGLGVTRTVRADRIGDRVPAYARGQVHSVFERACNIETRTGELVTLLAAKLGNVPHGIRLAGPIAPFESWLIPGQNAILDNLALRVPDAGITVDLSGAAVWRGAVAAVSMDLCAMDPGGGTIAAALRELRATLVERAPEQGFAPLLVGRAGASCSVERAFAARLSHTLPMLARSTERRDVPAIAGAAARLVGLGPGLTPSGDDFIAGYLAALWSRAGFENGIDAMLQPLADLLAPLFLCTNAISRQMLSDAAQGRFAERLVDVTIAIAGASDVVNATAHALASGHSSGADTLCGLLFGYAPDRPPGQPNSRAVQIESGASRTAAIA